ncbi:GntR family transcriptional regulator [Streptomyces sp. NPDC096030]|uniref:GntR family transcriptional regulator n=1 Tax=Streptomyces sp. NPDC096030 TaxID=3155423 RepID=UPI00332EF7A8
MRLAEQIIQDAQRAGGATSGLRRIPAERVLATSLGVNRQTLRRALEHLRARGLVHTDRSGTYTYTGRAVPARPTAGALPQPLFPVGAAFNGLAVRSHALLSYEPVPPPVEALLGLAPEQPTLVHRHGLTLLCGEPVQETISYFSPHRGRPCAPAGQAGAQAPYPARPVRAGPSPSVPVDGRVGAATRPP